MNEEGKISCMESYIPNRNLDNWEYIPKKLLDFYEVFNGWTLPEIQFMGLLPIESVKPIFEDSDKSYSKFKDFIVVFKNGGGGYLCFDKNNIKNSMVWWSDGDPMIELNLWDFLDEWILMGLTELS